MPQSIVRSPAARVNRAVFLLVVLALLWTARAHGAMSYEQYLQNRIVADPFLNKTFLLSGDGQAGSRDGGPDQASWQSPVAAALSGQTLYVVDQRGGALRAVDTSSREARTIAGGPARLAGMDLASPSGVAVLDGLVYVSDTGHSRIMVLDPATGKGGPLVDRSGKPLAFQEPRGLSVAVWNGRRLLFVGEEGKKQVAVVDLKDKARTASVPTPAAPYGIDFEPGSATLAVAEPEGHAVSVFKLRSQGNDISVAAALRFGDGTPHRTPPMGPLAMVNRETIGFTGPVAVHVMRHDPRFLLILSQGDSTLRWLHPYDKGFMTQMVLMKRPVMQLFDIAYDFEFMYKEETANYKYDGRTSPVNSADVLTYSRYYPVDHTMLHKPMGLAVDEKNQVIYTLDTGNHRLLRTVTDPILDDIDFHIYGSPDYVTFLQSLNDQGKRIIFLSGSSHTFSSRYTSSLQVLENELNQMLGFQGIRVYYFPTPFQGPPIPASPQGNDRYQTPRTVGATCELLETEQGRRILRAANPLALIYVYDRFIFCEELIKLFQLRFDADGRIVGSRRQVVGDEGWLRDVALEQEGALHTPGPIKDLAFYLWNNPGLLAFVKQWGKDDLARRSSRPEWFEDEVFLEKFRLAMSFLLQTLKGQLASLELTPDVVLSSFPFADQVSHGENKYRPEFDAPIDPYRLRGFLEKLACQAKIHYLDPFPLIRRYQVEYFPLYSTFDHHPALPGSELFGRALTALAVKAGLVGGWEDAVTRRNGPEGMTH